jgi:Polysaccharide deacetylase
LEPGGLPTRLALTVDGRTSEWDLVPAAGDTDNVSRRPTDGQNAPPAASSQRQAIYRSVWQLMQPLPEERRQSLLDELAAWAGRPRRARATHRPMTADEVLALAEGGLIEIGAHTVTHPVLLSLPQAAQRAEIIDSKAQAEALLGRSVTSFSYPHGQYTPETVALVREAGFACACHWRAVKALRPVSITAPHGGNWDGDEFARRVLGAAAHPL